MRKKLLLEIFFFIILWSNVYGNCNIQTDTANKGIVKVTCTSSSGKRLKVIIQKGEGKYTYDLTSGKTESFPLQMGNGAYKITVLENTSGKSYQIVDSTSVTAQMSDEKVVYLGSVQNVNWNTNNQAIKHAVQLTQATSDIGEKAKVLYKDMVGGTYSYDYNKLASLPTTYVPSIDSTFKEKKGICYDFSALFAAMLRSQGIPAKLVKGYSSNATGYHAWNEVYDSKTKQWLIIDTTYDIQVIKKKQVNMSKPSKDYNKVYEY